MYKQKLALIVILVLVCSSLRLLAQISIVPSSGCMPFGITNGIFSYTGSGVISNISWNFGDNTPVSNQNPTQHSYPNLGSYTVTLIGVVGGSPVTYTGLVTVNPQPTGAFTPVIPNNHCAPMGVTFNATSPLTNAVFNWDFGDGNLGSGNPASHAYNPGSYTPILTILNPITGCFFNITGTAIKISSAPLINLNVSPGTSTCAATYSPAFTASNSISGSPILGGGLTYNWNFGSFGNSTSATPGTIVFQPIGIYPVSLVVTDNNNCSSSTTINISLISPSVNAVVPATVCIRSQMPLEPNPPPNITYPNFTMQIQSSQASVQCNIGDGLGWFTFPKPRPAPLNTPLIFPNFLIPDTLHTYTTPGLKTITITATAGACMTSITRTIMVEQITPNFTATPPSFTCGPTFTLNYLNQSTVNTASSLSYTWTVPNWNQIPANAYTATALNPSIVIEQDSRNPYTIYSPHYSPLTKLYVQSSLGCQASVFHKYDSIQRPTAWFNKTKSGGCVPLTVTFRDSTFTSPLAAITAYTWCNGASPPVFVTGALVPPATIPNQVFNYTSTGTYTPYLIIQTVGGCIDKSFVDTIRVVTPPVISYTLPTSPVCAGQTVQILLDAGNTHTVTNWHVNTDNGYFSGCVTDKNPIWKFTQVGVHGFTITATASGCTSTLVPTETISVLGPIGKFRFETNCTGNKKDIKFYYNLQDVVTATLNFGDNSTPLVISGLANGTVNAFTNHIYPASGDYIVTMISSNPSNLCPNYTYTVLVYVRQITANFTVSTPVICKHGTPIFDATASIDVLKGCSTGYIWYADNYNPIQNSIPTHTSGFQFTTVGNHTMKLRVKDVNGCTDELTKTFRVSEPQPDFTFNANPICLSAMPAQMINTTPQLPDAVTNYTWTMGDSIYLLPPGHSVIIGTTAVHSPTFNFSVGAAQARTFSVVVKAKNSIGCISYKRHDITVNNPQILILGGHACFPNPVVHTIYAGATHTNYSFNFGDPNPLSTGAYSTNTAYTLPHYYQNPGIYTPTVTLTDNGGCTTSLVLPAQHVQVYPVASFTLNNAVTGLPGINNGFCLPFTLSVTSTSQYTPPLTYYWDFGKGDPITITPNPFGGATFTNTGQFTASLTVLTTPANCSASTNAIFTVYDPFIEFSILPVPTKTLYCLGEPINFSVTARSLSTSYFIWDFGNGVVQPKISSFLPAFQNAIYSNTFFPVQSNGELTIELTGYGGDACKYPDRKKIRIIRILNDFKRNNELGPLDYTHCLGKLDRFENLSSTNSTESLVFNWSFGDGSSAVTTDASHTYSLPGIYTVKLDALEPVNNCTATASKNMTVFPNPKAQLAIADSSCPGVTFTISGSGQPGVSGQLVGVLSPTTSSSSFSFNPNNTFTTQATASVSTTYSLKVTDENGCEGSAPTVSIFVQPAAPRVDWDTTIIIGQITPLNAYAGAGFTYTWSPLVTSLNCNSTTCLFYNPVSTTTVNLTYTVFVEDALKCSIVKNTYRINVDPRVSIDVPTAFTPNGDGVNDVIFPDGWGIRKLLYFKVFNRWGQLVFESNNFKEGWNGVFNGVPQNIETYVYQVSAETYLDAEPVLTKTGTFKLLR